MTIVATIGTDECASPPVAEPLEIVTTPWYSSGFSKTYLPLLKLNLAINSVLSGHDEVTCEEVVCSRPVTTSVAPKPISVSPPNHGWNRLGRSFPLVIVDPFRPCSGRTSVNQPLPGAGALSHTSSNATGVGTTRDLRPAKQPDLLSVVVNRPTGQDRDSPGMGACRDWTRIWVSSALAGRGLESRKPCASLTFSRRR